MEDESDEESNGQGSSPSSEVAVDKESKEFEAEESGTCNSCLMVFTVYGICTA